MYFFLEGAFGPIGFTTTVSDSVVTSGDEFLSVILFLLKSEVICVCFSGEKFKMSLRVALRRLSLRSGTASEVPYVGDKLFEEDVLLLSIGLV
jgi:hypothetical protein